MSTKKTSKKDGKIAKKLERRVTQLTTLNKIGRHLTSFLAQKDLLQEALEALKEDFGFLQAAVMLKDKEADNLYMVSATDNFQEIIPENYRQALGEGAIGIAAQTGETVIINNAAEDSRPYQAGEWLSASSVSSPIKIDEVVIGVLEVESDVTNAFDDNDIMVIDTIADQIAVSIKNAQLYEQAQQEIKERKRIEKESQESETKYRAIVEQNHDAIYIYKNDYFIFVNDMACKITGYSKEELLKISIWDLLASKDREKIKDIGQKRAKGEKAPNNYTAKVLRKDGKIRICDFSVNVIQYHGEYAVLGVARDITERKNIEEQLRRQERLAAIGQLAGGIAHDFRNFLTTIILHTQIAQRGASLSPNIDRSLTTVIDEARQASNLIQQILDFSRHSTVTTTPTNLAKLIQQSTTILRKAVPESIQFFLELTPAECVVEVDDARFQQVLINLATNARDAMPNGGEIHIKLSKITVKSNEVPPISEMPPGEWAKLLFTDTGTGMTQEVEAHLFEPFFTTKEPGSGTGLGLAQVFGIIRHHKGFIAVDTETGKGSTFQIYLPIYKPETTIEDQKRELEKTFYGHGETILLVEDDDRLREVAEEVLSSLKYQVLTANNGLQALKVYRDQPVDLVITDLVMPKMSGQELRNMLMRTGPAKVIAITGHIMQTSKEKLKKNGFLEVIEKPFNVDELAKIVHQVLN